MRFKRKFDFDALFEQKAWYVNELAGKVGISPTAMRRYLRILCFTGKLGRVRNGRYWIYFVEKDYEAYKKSLKETNLGGEVNVGDNPEGME